MSQVTIRLVLVLSLCASALVVPVSAAEAKPKVGGLSVVACDSTTIYGWAVPSGTLDASLEADLWQLPVDWQHHPDVRPTKISATFVCIGNCSAFRLDLARGLAAKAEYIVRLVGRAGGASAVRAVGRFATDGKATLSHVPGGGPGVHTLAVTSPVRLRRSGPLNVVVSPQQQTPWTVPNVTLVRDPAEVDCRQVVNPRGLGRVQVDVRFPTARPALAGSELALVGLHGPFGDVRATGKYAATVPKTDKEAEYYVALSYLGSDEKPDAFGLDLKVEPALYVRGNWQVGPRLFADVARNADSPNSGKLGFVARHSSAPGGRMALSTWTFGVGAEADRDLDRVNGVFDLGWQPRLAALDHSRELKRLRKIRRTGSDPADVPLPRWGWGIEPRVGAEIGRSLRTQTFRNADTGQRVEVDRYDILRPLAALRGYVEWQRWMLDLAGTLRYLVDDEPTVREAPDDMLLLRENDDFEPYLESKLTYKIDPAGHQVLELTYKNGGLPPTFERTDAFTFGIAVKY